MSSRTPRKDDDAKGPAIRVRGLRKAFGAQVVLDGLDLAIGSRTTLVVLGRSGTGKSVLLKLLVGLVKPDAGSIEVQGQDITKLTLERLNEVRKKMGFLFQFAALHDSMTVEENVAFPLQRHADMPDAERRKRARELLARVGMEKDAAKMPADVSGGMKKRVGLARALALDPEVLLLDEPTAGLDPITAEEIVELIQELREERSLSAVVVTHDIRSVEALADRVTFLHEGKLVVDAPFEQVRRSDHPVVSAFLKAG